MPGTRGQHLEIDDSTLSGLVDDAPDAVVVVDAAMTVRYVNPAVRAVLGYEPDELLGQDYSVLIPEHLRSTHVVNHALFMSDPSARPMGSGLALRARCRDGSTIPVEIALVPLRTGDLVAAFVRDITVRHRLTERVNATNELVTAMLAGADRAEALGQVTRLSRRLTDASRCWFGEVSAGTTLTLRAADGPGTEDALGTVQELPAHFLDSAGAVIDLTGDGDGQRRLRLPGADPAGGPTFAVPVRIADDVVGLLILSRSPESSSFDPLDVEIASQFASTVALALDLLRTRDERLELMTVADHDRIARDLHDTVIQRIFAVALRLESAIQVTSGTGAERMREAVDQLDEVIRDLRASIFNLQRPLSGGHGVRDHVQDVVSEYRETLGFMPRLGFQGPVDTVVPAAHATELVAALREALSNVARHARASMVEVVVSANDELTLSVADDGVGPSSEPSAGHGLENLQARAENLGGTCTVRRRSAGGTVVEWRVPLDHTTD